MLDSISSLNQNLFFTIFDLSGHSNFVDTLMMFLAQYLIFIAFIAAIILSLKSNPKDKKALLLASFSLALSFVILRVLNLLFFEPRPFVTFPIQPLLSHIPDASFPSEHSTILATLSFSYLFYKSKYGRMLIIPPIFTGFARVYTGIHYPWDILGGFIVGFISVFTIWQLKKAFFQKVL